MLVRLMLIHIEINTSKHNYMGEDFHLLDETDIKNICILPDNAYPVEFNISTKNNSMLLSRAHFRFNGREYFAAFQIIDDNGCVISDDFRISYKQFNSKILIHYDSKRKIFYDLPYIRLRFDKNSNRQYVKYANSLKDGALGSIFAGDTDLVVEDKDGNEKLLFKLRVLPSSLSYEAYKNMIDDLININLDLLASKEKDSKQYIGITASDLLYSKIYEKILSIKQICSSIDDNPYTSLAYEINKISTKNLKKYDNRVIRNLAINPCADKVSVMLPKQSVDIYEHQLIKKILINLKDTLSSFLTTKNNNIESLLKDNRKRLELIMKKYGFKISELECAKQFFSQMKLMGSRFNDAQKEAYFKRMISNLKIVEETSEEKYILLSFNDEFKKHKLYFNDNVLCSEHISSCRPKKILKFCSYDLKKHIIFWNAARNCVKEKVMLRCKIKKCKAVKNDRNESFTTIYVISDFEVLKGIVCYKNGSAVKFEAEDFAIKYLKNEFLKNNDMNNLENDSELFIQLIRRDERLNEIIHSECFSQWKEKLENEIDEVLALSFLKFSSLKDVEIHQTQIFDNDIHYNRIFEILSNFNEVFQLDFLNSSHKILIKETHKLYEYWLLAKMIHILIIEQGWNTSEITVNSIPIKDIDNSSIIKAIGENLSLESSKNNDKNSISITLKHPCGMIICIKFNVSLQYTNLTPDYFITVSYNRSEKHFILDAKYRDYEDMGENAFYNDIQEVCYNKYLERLNREWEAHGLKNEAAFIVSNGSRIENNKVESRWNYWGGYIQSKINNTDHIYPKHTYGAFVCCPGMNARGLKKFFKMIFEYHMEKWDICWNCGHILDEREKRNKYTNSYHNTIYHCTCNVCNEFWVKSYCAGSGHLLIKHDDNFHEEVDHGYHWYVECPECGQF